MRRSALFQAIAVAGVAFLVRGLHLRFAAASPLFQAPTGDEFENWDLALRLGAGNWLGYGLGPYFRPQLFAYFLAVLQRVTSGSPALAHLLLALLDAATVGILYLVARHVWPRRTALVSALLIGTYWPFVYFCATFNKESFAIHLQAWLLLALVRWTRGRVGGARRRYIRLAGAAGLLAGLGLLTRPPLLLPWAGVLVAMVLQARRRGEPLPRSLLYPALAAGLTVLTLVPQAWRNVTVGNAPVLYSTHGWLNLYLGNNRNGDTPQAHSPGIAWDLFVERPQIEERVAADDYAGINAFWKKRFLESALRSPAGLLGGFLSKGVTAVNALEAGVTNSLQEMRRLSPVLRCLPGTGLLLPLALVGAVCWGGERPRARRDAAAFLLVFAVLAFVATALVFAVTRDRLAGMSVLLLFTGAGVQTLMNAATAFRQRQSSLSEAETPRRSRRPAAVPAALLASVLVVNWPVPDRGEPAFEAWLAEINQGDALIQLWDKEHQPWQISGAITAYEAALRMRPGELQPLKQLPPAYLRAGRLAEALQTEEVLVGRLRRDYARNVVVRSRETEILGRLAMQADRPDKAEAAAREWQSLGVNTPAAMDLQAVALAREGKLAAARAVVEARARLTPGDPSVLRLMDLIRSLEGKPH
jgi:4-amino-4-deoxy-L-arabinose transferase-like glycosyltransferase